MPAQKRRRLDQERARPRQQPAERRQQDPIGRPQTRPTYLAPQHLQLMPQHQDLHFLRPLRTTKQNQQLEQTANDPVSEAQTLKQQTSRTHRPTLPARTTPSYSPLHQPRGPAERRTSLWDPQGVGVPGTIGTANLLSAPKAARRRLGLPRGAMGAALNAKAGTGRSGGTRPGTPVSSRRREGARPARAGGRPSHPRPGGAPLRPARAPSPRPRRGAMARTARGAAPPSAAGGCTRSDFRGPPGTTRR
jgi:hypothetical protein